MSLRLVFALVAITFSLLAAKTETLDMYFIDVEGGQSTLIVTPAHESLLIDAGFPGEGKFTSEPGDPANARDANRIAAAARDADISQIDYLLITHFHADHDGGVPELAQLMPIRTFIDHGNLKQPGYSGIRTVESFKDYKGVRKNGRHVLAKPGDRLPIQDVDAIIVSSARAGLSRPLPGAGQPNSYCATAELPAQDIYENPRSTGIAIGFGKFSFIDLGDLSGTPLFALFCPNDLLGPADVFVIPHHGGVDAAHPAIFGAVNPRIAIMNNGATKGGYPGTFATLRRRAIDTWQIDRSTNDGVVNFPSDRIANLDDGTSFWIKVSAKSDGSFVVANSRTKATEFYAPR